MLLRAMIVWIGILVLAAINGAVRDLLVGPRLGDVAARALSTVLLCVLILVVTWYTIDWIGPGNARNALLVGMLWVALTLGFEFLAGHYLFHKSWPTLLEDYDVRRGRIWIAVLVVTFGAPVWMGRVRGLFAPGT